MQEDPPQQHKPVPGQPQRFTAPEEILSGASLTGMKVTFFYGQNASTRLGSGQLHGSKPMTVQHLYKGTVSCPSLAEALKQLGYKPAMGEVSLLVESLGTLHVLP